MSGTGDYPTDGKKFICGTGTYRWKQYKKSYKCPYGQLGTFQVMVWKGDYFRWKKAYCLSPGQEWEYV